jgi:hypothetical protein
MCSLVDTHKWARQARVVSSFVELLKIKTQSAGTRAIGEGVSGGASSDLVGLNGTI